MPAAPDAAAPAPAAPRARPSRLPLTVVVLALVAGFVVVTLGPAVVGVRVFHASDLVYRYAPWAASAPAGFEASNPCMSDTVDSVLPQRALFSRELREGDVPLWNPYGSGGTTLGAVPDGAYLSPMALPYLVLPAWWAPAVAKLLEVLVAVGGFVLLLRRLGASAVAGLVGGLLYVASAFMVVWSNWPQTAVAALVPLLFWSVERYVQVRTPRALLPIAGVVAAMLLGGFPAVTALGLYAAGAYFLVRLAVERRRESAPVVRPAVGAGLAVGLGVVLALVHLVPFALRLAGLDLDRANTPEDHLPLDALLTAVVPGGYGTCGSQEHFYFGPGNQVESESAFGSAGLLLAGVGLLATPLHRAVRGPRAFFGAVVGVVVLVAYVGGPFLATAQLLPTVGSSYIGRIRFLLGFALAVLAALGVEALLHRVPARRARLLAIGLPVAGVVLALVSLPLVRTLRNEALTAQSLGYAHRQLALAALGVLVAGGLVALAVRRPDLRRLAVALLVLVVTLQATLFASSYWPLVPRDAFYPRTDTHRFLDAELGHDRYAAAGFALFPGTSTYYEQRALTGHAFTQPAWGDLLEAADPEVFATATYSRFIGTPGTASSPVLDRFGARYWVSGPELPLPGPVTRAPATGTTTWVPGEVLDLDVPDAPLRGVGVTLAEPLLAPGAVVELELVDDAGAVLAETFRRLGPATPAGHLVVPVAAEDVDTSGGVQARLALTGTDQMAQVAASGPDVVPVVVGTADDGLRIVRDGEAAVLERTRALPRIRWAHTAEVETDPEARVQRLADEPAEPGTVLLSEPGLEGDGRDAELEVLDDDVDRVEVRVQADGAGHLVVADALTADWVAEVDGEQVEVVEGDHAFGAVPVPEGEHVVVLRYAPQGLSLGLAGTVLGLVAAGLLAAWPRPRRWAAQSAERLRSG